MELKKIKMVAKNLGYDDITTGVVKNKVMLFGKKGYIVVARKEGKEWKPVDTWSGIPSSGFGEGALAISGDGNTIAVGCRHSAMVFIFNLKEHAILSHSSIYPTTNTDLSQFSASVDISYDGKLIIVGDPGGLTDHNDERPLLSSGCAYVFMLDPEDNTYKSVKKLTADDRCTGDVFGTDVSISDDGRTMAVSSPYSNLDAKSNHSVYAAGAVYIYKVVKSTSASASVSVQKITAAERCPHGMFGISLELDSKGDEITVVSKGIKGDYVSGSNTLKKKGKFRFQFVQGSWISI